MNWKLSCPINVEYRALLSEETPGKSAHTTLVNTWVIKNNSRQLQVVVFFTYYLWQTI